MYIGDPLCPNCAFDEMQVIRVGNGIHSMNWLLSQSPLRDWQLSIVSHDNQQLNPSLKLLTTQGSFSSSIGELAIAGSYGSNAAVEFTVI